MITAEWIYPLGQVLRDTGYCRISKIRKIQTIPRCLLT